MTDRAPRPPMIIVMGLPRSGTTWLGKIFDSHPATYYAHEPDSARPMRDIPLLIDLQELDGLKERLVSVVEALRDLRTIRVVGKLPLFPKSFTSALPFWWRSQAMFFYKSLSRAFGDLTLPRHVCGDADRASAWVWKSIESTGRLGAIARAFPRSKVVFIVRHPCAVAASLFKGQQSMKFSAGPASEDYGFFALLSETAVARSRGLTLDRFHAMSPVERVAWRWALLNEKTLADVSGLPNCTVLRYEDLCERPAEVSRAMFDFAGLPWDQQTERFVLSSTTRDDHSYYGVFKDPRQSANKWKEELTRDVTAQILQVVADTSAGRLYLEMT